MSETNPKSPGWKTTEFWVTLFVVAVTAIVDADVFGENSTVTKILVSALGFLKAFGYTAQRAEIKKALIFNAPKILPFLLIVTLSACATVGPSGQSLGKCVDATILTDDWKERIGADVGKLVSFGIDGIDTGSWRGFASNALMHLAASYGARGGDLVSCFLGLPRLSSLPIFGNIGGAAGDNDPRVEERLKVLQSFAEPPGTGPGMDR